MCPIDFHYYRSNPLYFIVPGMDNRTFWVQSLPLHWRMRISIEQQYERN